MFNTSAIINELVYEVVTEVARELSSIQLIAGTCYCGGIEVFWWAFFVNQQRMLVRSSEHRWELELTKPTLEEELKEKIIILFEDFKKRNNPRILGCTSWPSHGREIVQHSTGYLASSEKAIGGNYEDS